jgi:hypothetical protein
MIATLKTGARHTRILAKVARLATTVWWAGGVVARAKDAYQDRQTEAIVADQVKAAEHASMLQRVRGWADEFSQVVRVRTALAVLLWVLGAVLVAEFSQASCAAGQVLGCRIAKSVIGSS